MQIRFNASLETGEADISPASLRDLDEMSALLAADIMQDIVCDALRAYNTARERMGWEPLESFSIGLDALGDMSVGIHE